MPFDDPRIEAEDLKQARGDYDISDAETEVSTEIIKLIWLAEFSQNCKHLGSVMRALKETN